MASAMVWSGCNDVVGCLLKLFAPHRHAVDVCFSCVRLLKMSRGQLQLFSHMEGPDPSTFGSEKSAQVCHLANHLALSTEPYLTPVTFVEVRLTWPHFVEGAAVARQSRAPMHWTP